MLRYFIGFKTGIWMKRWRCPDCKAVHTTRPIQYCPGIQYTRHQQVLSLFSKLSRNYFLKSIPRQTQQHWRKLFLRQLHKKNNWGNPIGYLQNKLKTGQFWLTKRTILYENWSSAIAPYLSFALTTKGQSFRLE